MFNFLKKFAVVEDQIKYAPTHPEAINFFPGKLIQSA